MNSERNDILELMEARSNKKSTILCSQWSPEGWYQKLGEGPVADAILDRVLNSSYTILLQGKSMREEYSKVEKKMSQDCKVTGSHLRIVRYSPPE